MDASQERLRKAFLLAARNAVADGAEHVEPADVAFAALKEAMETLKRLPDPEAGWLFSQGFWPQIREDHEDQLEAYQAMLKRIAEGSESADILLKARRPTPDAIMRMEAIFEVYPRLLIGAKRRRDWKILCYMANGMDVKVISRLTECHKKSVYDRRYVQMAAISRKLDDLFPDLDKVIGAPRAPRTHAVAYVS